MLSLGNERSTVDAKGKSFQTPVLKGDRQSIGWKVKPRKVGFIRNV
jgi:hypothetical protein